MIDTYELTQLTEKLEKALIQSYGHVLSSHDLWQVLGYKTVHAYRQARHRKTLPVPEFKIQGRRGYFVLTVNVARYLSQLHLSVETNVEEEKRILNN